MNKINYSGSSKVIIRLCEIVNWLLDNSSAANISITRISTTGKRVADISVNETTYQLYAENELPFTVQIDSTDNGVNIIYDDDILN